MTGRDCPHGDDRLLCPVAACNPRAARDPFDGPSRWHTMIARYGSACAAGCPDRIEPGDPIVWCPDAAAAAHTACREQVQGAA